MAETYRYTKNEQVEVDQKWATDVTHIAREKLQWDGTSMTPKVDSLVVNKASGKGLKVDEINPTYPWFDMLGEIRVDREAASNKPSFNTYEDGIKQYQFLVNDRVYINFHMVHDYAVGTDMYIHTHWSGLGVDSGSVTWTFDVTYSKGHQQGAFITPVIIPVTQAYISDKTHMIAETQLSAVGGAGGLLDTASLEPDGVFLIRVTLSAKTITNNPFLHYVDIHYQSTGIGTKNKAPNFYA